MPGLLRGMARTAVVAGTATAVSNRVSRRQGQRWAEKDAQADTPESSEAQQPDAPAAGGEDRIEKLKDLADLKEQGALTDEEFASEKARILGE